MKLPDMPKIILQKKTNYAFLKSQQAYQNSFKIIFLFYKENNIIGFQQKLMTQQNIYFGMFSPLGGMGKGAVGTNRRGTKKFQELSSMD